MSVNSKNPRVQQFLDDTLLVSPDKHAIVQAARAVVFRQNPAVSERFIYGGIMFSLGDDFGGIFAYKNHVSFAFGQGYQLEDPGKVLEGSGKFRRHLKLCNLSDIQDKNTDYFVAQAIELLEK